MDKDDLIDPINIIFSQASNFSERIHAARDWLDKNLRNDTTKSREIIDMMIPEASKADDKKATAWLLFFRAWLEIDADRLDLGFGIMESVKAEFENLGDKEGLARCLNALGSIFMARGVFDLALDNFRESVSEAEKISRLDLAAAGSGNMAECLSKLDEPLEALQVIEHCRRDYSIAPYNISSFHNQAGLIFRSLGRLPEAENELRESILAAGNAIHDSLEARQTLAEVLIDLEQLAEADSIVAVGLQDCGKANERMLGACFKLTRARIAALRGNNTAALADLRQVIEAAQELGTRKIEADAEKAAYLAWQACGENKNALDAYIRYSLLKDSMKSEQISKRILGLHDERLRRETRHFETLYKQISTISEIGQRITANLDIDTALTTIYDSVNGLMDAPTLLIALVDEEKNCLDYRLVMVRGKRQDPYTRPLDKESFGNWCVKNRSDILIGDIETEYHEYLASPKTLLLDGSEEKSLVFVPLVIGDKVAGVISVQSHLTNAYDKKKVETIRAIGSYIAIAIENTKLFRQVQKLASIDGLTDLLNRRRFTELLEEAYLKCRRYGSSAGVIMIDVDYFKNVNDKRGHDAGDMVLKKLAQVLTGIVRTCDSVGRFGGEEFIILLPETDLEGAGTLAERLRLEVEGMQITCGECAGRAIAETFGVTASFGVSVIRPADASHEAVLKRADKAMYNAKQTGRNKVCMEYPE